MSRERLNMDNEFVGMGNVDACIFHTRRQGPIGMLQGLGGIMT